MRAVGDYGPAEWATGAPLLHGFKRVRNMAIDRTFRAMRPAGLERFLSGLGAAEGGTITIVTAFNTPWAVALLARASARHIAGTLVVCDNSRSREARREIERICRDGGVHYLALPSNPERHPCRSHGVALNWAYYNVVLPLRPKVFAFLDHDLFTVAPLDPAAVLGDAPAYGRRKESAWGWYLWPGYCMFALEAVAGRGPDFNTDIPRQLDTGGQNWNRIFRHLDRDRLRFAEMGVRELRDGAESVKVQTVDGCLHFSGASFGGYSRPAEASGVFARIVERLAQGEPIALPEAPAA